MTIAIVGGGAAGIFAAIRCKQVNPKLQVVVLEKTNQLLAKVRISGGGRCNVTHACFDPLLLVKNYPRGTKELLGPFHTFQPKDTVGWFEERGVTLKAEEDGRMFPTTDSSETIIRCLLDTAEREGVEIRKQQHLTSVQKEGAQFVLQLPGGEIRAEKLLLATGSGTGGHDMARHFGHEIVAPVPSLFTFNVPSSPLLDLSGISVPDATVSLPEIGLRQRGPLLLTHWGFSGPAVLKLSAWAARELHAHHYQTTVHINWTSAPNSQTLYQTLLQLKETRAKQTLLPQNLWQRLQLDPSTPLPQLPNSRLRQLAEKLYADAYSIEGKTTYKQEFVTAGGVCLREIDFKTMQSKKTAGLFFAGEILDVDGVTGGFNFQNAWTTGYLAGTAMSLF